MTVKRNHIFLWIFLISTFMNGSVWEGIGWIAILFIMINCKGRHGFLALNRIEAKTFVTLLIVIAYVVLQVSLLHLNSAQTIRLYGISKTVFAFLIIYFFLSCYIRKNDVVNVILPLLFFLNLAYFIYLITGYEMFNLIGGSRNYLGAINILFIPYVLKFIPKEKRKLKTVWIIMIILIALFIGSRTTLALTVCAFLLTGLMENGIKKKIKTIFILALCAVMAYLMMPIIGKNANFSRAFSVFKSISDQARVDLADSMWNQFNNYSHLQQLIGNGNNMVIWRECPPHNFIYELLLCYGKIGVSFFLLGIIVVVGLIIKSKTLNKKYCLLVIGLALVVGLVQPFITSGYFFQCLVAIVTLDLFYGDNSVVRN